MKQQADPGRTTVEDLVHVFETSRFQPNRLAPSESDLARWGIRAHPLKPLFYVPPTLECTAHPQGDSAFCYLVSAPAAVGKTTLANHLHERLTGTGRIVLYVPLHRARIGDRYLAGLLSEAFPNASRLQLYESLFNGSVVLLFDGYDEVSMTTWQIALNRRFIDEVVQAYQAHGPGPNAIPCLVFLYRSIFIETGIFDALLPLAAQYRVEFFDASQRRQYLRSYLQTRGQQGEKLVPLVDQFLAGFEQRASAASPQAEAFFGHAIVLSSFGDFLLDQDERNVFRLAQELAAEGVDETNSVKILKGVIDRLLSREASNFPRAPSLEALGDFSPFDRELQEAIISQLASGPTAGSLLADVHSLAGRLGRQKLDACPAFAGLSEQAQQTVAQDYLQNLASKVEMHPFVNVAHGRLMFRNPIYQEYYLARYLAERPSVPLSSIINPDRPLSAYLALFLLSLVPQRDLTGYGQAIFYTLRLLSSACRGDEYQIDITYHASTTSWVARVESEYLSVGTFYVGRDPLLTLELPADGVLQNFALDGQDEGLVSVSGPPGYDTRSPILLSQGVVTGVEVELNASAITFDTITVNADQLTLAQRLGELNGLDSLTLRPRQSSAAQRQEGQGEFVLQASDYARNRWGKELVVVTDDVSTLETFRAKVQKLLLPFRKHHRADYGAYRPRFYACATSKRKDVVAMQVVQFLLDQSILRDGTMMLLNQERLAEYEVFYAKQNQLHFGSGFKKLFEQWRESTQP